MSGRLKPLLSHTCRLALVFFGVKISRDEPANLTTVCFHHHLEGIHRGVVGVNGRAPDKLVWELGRKAGEAPILATGGDLVFSQEAGIGRHQLTSTLI